MSTPSIVSIFLIGLFSLCLNTFISANELVMPMSNDSTIQSWKDPTPDQVRKFKLTLNLELLKLQSNIYYLLSKRWAVGIGVGFGFSFTNYTIVAGPHFSTNHSLTREPGGRGRGGESLIELLSFSALATYRSPRRKIIEMGLRVARLSHFGDDHNDFAIASFRGFFVQPFYLGKNRFKLGARLTGGHYQDGEEGEHSEWALRLTPIVFRIGFN
ncbi:MAG: hypothetical protein AAFP19_17360 [Bacteroidota bacterium]